MQVPYFLICTRFLNKTRFPKLYAEYWISKITNNETTRDFEDDTYQSLTLSQLLSLLVERQSPFFYGNGSMSSQNARKSNANIPLDKHNKSALDEKLSLTSSTSNSSKGSKEVNNNPYDLSNNFPCNGFGEGPFEDNLNQMVSDGEDITLLDMLQWSIQPPHPITSSLLKTSKKNDYVCDTM